MSGSQSVINTPSSGSSKFYFNNKQVKNINNSQRVKQTRKISSR